MSTSLGAIGHMNSIASGYAAQQATNAYNTVTTQSAGTGTITQFGQPIWPENQHIFDCQKVENGWTLQYRNKRFIAADLDSLMDHMKAAMVLERIDK